MIKYLDDLLFLSGAVLITIGAYALCPVSTWFVVGGFCIVGSLLYGLSQRSKA